MTCLSCKHIRTTTARNCSVKVSYYCNKRYFGLSSMSAVITLGQACLGHQFESKVESKVEESFDEIRVNINMEDCLL